jgi:hypothetical protein
MTPVSTFISVSNAKSCLSQKLETVVYFAPMEQIHARQFNQGHVAK